MKLEAAVRCAVLAGVVAGLALTSCARRRSAEKVCEEASKTRTVTSLVQTVGTPDRTSHGQTKIDDVDWWGYDGVDGVCIVTVAKNSVAPDPTFLHSYKPLPQD
jgi:hypothetical protein